MRIPSASARAERGADRARASSIRPRWAAMTAAGNSPGGIRRPSCVLRSSESAAYRSASSQFPARHSSKPRFHSAHASFAGSLRPGRVEDSMESSRAASSVGRPEELMARLGGPAVERPVRQRSLERDRLVHLGARDAAAGVERASPRRPRVRGTGGAASSVRDAARTAGSACACRARCRASSASVRRGGGGCVASSASSPSASASASR